MKNKSSEGCSCGSGCCEPKQVKKQIHIDFLYLDLTLCERCQGTEKNLEEAIQEVSEVLKAAGYEIMLNKVNVNTEELAEKYEFLSSPTIRINGKDIDLEVKETCCKECGDLCGDNVDCRVWEYEGVEYNEPPKAMIINAILKEVYGGASTGAQAAYTTPVKKKLYSLPSNLKVFYEGVEGKKKK